MEKMDKNIPKNLVLLDFYATWCGSCQTMKPILNRMGTIFKEKIEILHVDVDDNRPVASHFKIKSVPTFILLIKGKPVWRKNNLISERDFRGIINSFLDH